MRLTRPFPGGTQALGGASDAIFMVVGVYRGLHEGELAESGPSSAQPELTRSVGSAGRCNVKLEPAPGKLST
jgi:hypothetical protein